jgi:hypothetical protein
MSTASKPGTLLAVLALSITAMTAFLYFGRYTHAQPGTPFITFEQVLADDPAEYGSYQVKITYTGDQQKTVPTLLLFGPDREPDVAEFLPFRSPGVHYGNDDTATVPVGVSAEMIAALVEAGLATRPPLQVAAEEQLAAGFQDPVLSLMVERTPSLVFEHLADGIDARHSYDVVLGAGQGESAETRELLRRFRNVMVGP